MNSKKVLSAIWLITITTLSAVFGYMCEPSFPVISGFIGFAFGALVLCCIFDLLVVIKQ
jgi:hypothetical protein